MSLSDEIVIRRDDLVRTQKQVPCIMLLDVSGSMAKDNKIGSLNEGLRTYQTYLQENLELLNSVELATILFGTNEGDGVELQHNFLSASKYVPKKLEAVGYTTPLGLALEYALELANQCKLDYKRDGIAYTRPWIIVISDGGASDVDIFKNACKTVHAAEAARQVDVYTLAVGMDKAVDIDSMNAISSKRNSLPLRGTDFIDFFEWLGDSQEIISGEGEEEAPQSLPSVSKFSDGWDTVDISTDDDD